jgi:LemA protein
MRTIGRAGVLAASIIVALLLLVGACVVTYNTLMRLGQAAAAQWAQVEDADRRRTGLIPELVTTVKGAPTSSKKTSPM